MIIIAELGSNPAPNWPFRPYLDAAASAGATHVKVQLFKAEHFPEEERESKRVIEFPRDYLPHFVRMAHNRGLKAGASVFDAEAVEQAAKHCDFIKLASREHANHSLIGSAGDANMPLYRSIDYQSMAYQKVYAQMTTLYTIQKYPTGLLLALFDLWLWKRYADRFDMSFGWSSHTRSIWDCVLAARWGASVVEKHFMLGDGREEPEAGWSLNPAEFKRMTKRINV